MRKPNHRLMLLISLLMIVVGSIVGYLVQTGLGTVRVSTVSWVTDDGAKLFSRLYIPKGVTSENKAPAVVSCHGWNNTNEVQGMNAIELSRRGYVVLAIDAYGHGNSTFPVGATTGDDTADGILGNGVSLDLEGDAIVTDMGVYSALQYVGNLPFVDTANIGLVGHSMGGSTIQYAALRAFRKHEDDPTVTVPRSVLPTAQSLIINAAGDGYLLQKYSVNLGAVFSRWDEWAKPMWGVAKGLDVNKSRNTKIAFGFDLPQGITYGDYYAFGQPHPISRMDAVTAADSGDLRVIYQPLRTHPGTHNDFAAARYVVDFFNITLKNGANESISLNQQIWLWKDIFGMIALLGFFLFATAFGSLLLELPFFASLFKPPYQGAQLTTRGEKNRYFLLFLLGLIPSALVFYPLMGYPISIKAMNRFVDIPLQVNSYFQMPIMNGLVLFNIVAGILALAFFYVANRVYNQGKSKFAVDSSQYRISFNNFGKALLLALGTFLASYTLLALSDYFFGVDYRFFTLSIKTITPAKWLMYLKYLPFFALFYVINSFTLNMATAIAEKREWVNYLICAMANVGGLLILGALDYGWLFSTGVKMFLTVPYPKGATSALAGVLGWGLLFILPIAGVIARYFYKKTGNIWVGGLINTFLVTFFALSNTAIGLGMI